MKFAILIALIAPLTTFAQVSHKGVIADENGHTLPYTNIVSVSKQSGTITDENGTFQLEKFYINDTVKITNIAYQPVLISIKELMTKDTIFLTEKLLSLDEVVLTNFSKFRDKEKIGYLNFRKLYGFSASPAGQVGMYIENKRKMPGWIKELAFNTEKDGPCKNDFRIRFIKFDANLQKPTLDLIHDDIIIKYADIKKTTKIDVSDYHILMPRDGVVVLFEWINADANCTYKSQILIKGNMELHQDQMWFNFKDQSWHRIRRAHSNGDYAALNVGLTVAY